MKTFYKFLFLTLILGACSNNKKIYSPKESPKDAKQSLLVMSYSGDKLFSENEKSKLGTFVRSLSSGFGPDIFILQNIQDEDDFLTFAEKEISKFGYKYFSLSEANPEFSGRSAIFSRFAFVEKPHTHSLPEGDILEVGLSITDKKVLRTFLLQPRAAETDVKLVAYIKEISSIHSGEVQLLAEQQTEYPKFMISNNAQFHAFSVSKIPNLPQNRPLVAEILMP